MKPNSVLIFLIFNSILWSLINSVKNNKNQNVLTRVEETSRDPNKVSNDGAESSIAPQNEKYRETLKPTTKFTIKHKTENNEEETKLKQKEYMKNYYQQHKEEIQKHCRNYYQNNKEKRLQYKKDYYQKNRDRMSQYKRKYRQDNKDKTREYKRKYRLKKKNEREILQNNRSDLGNMQNTNEGTSLLSSQNDNFIRENTTENNKAEKKLAIKEYNKNYYQKNKEKLRESRLNKRERKREYNKNYIQKNKESRREYDRKYYLKRKNGKGNSQNDNYRISSKIGPL